MSPRERVGNKNIQLHAALPGPHTQLGTALPVGSQTTAIGFSERVFILHTTNVNGLAEVQGRVTDNIQYTTSRKSIKGHVLRRHQ